jgi:hypothetical protein
MWYAGTYTILVLVNGERLAHTERVKYVIMKLLANSTVRIGDINSNFLIQTSLVEHIESVKSEEHEATLLICLTSSLPYD